MPQNKTPKDVGFSQLKYAKRASNKIANIITRYKIEKKIILYVNRNWKPFCHHDPKWRFRQATTSKKSPWSSTSTRRVARTHTAALEAAARRMRATTTKMDLTVDNESNAILIRFFHSNQHKHTYTHFLSFFFHLLLLFSFRSTFFFFLSLIIFVCWRWNQLTNTTYNIY